MTGVVGLECSAGVNGRDTGASTGVGGLDVACTALMSTGGGGRHRSTNLGGKGVCDIVGGAGGSTCKWHISMSGSGLRGCGGGGTSNAISVE